MFLIADAPPHLDYEDDYDYAVEMQGAAGRGIKIFPIASSGLDVQGEYIFRQIALHTMGRFIFILYGGKHAPRCRPILGGEPGRPDRGACRGRTGSPDRVSVKGSRPAHRHEYGSRPVSPIDTIDSVRASKKSPSETTG